MTSPAVALDKAKLFGDETIATPFGALQLEDAFLTDESSALLFDVMDAQRAAQAYYWSLPLVGFAFWRDEQIRVYEAAKFGDFVVFDSLKEKRGIVTANLTTPYIINWTNLSDGPVLIDYPQGQTAGGVLDFWQRPVCDLGLTGPDAGKGGKYMVIAPQDDASKHADSGRIVIQSATNNLLIGLRILNPDPQFAEGFKAALAMSRLGEEPRPVRFVEGLDREWSATPPRGMAYWECLAKILSEEPVREVDKIMMAMLEPLGIVKGQPFKPDARQTRILTEAAALGELMMRNNQVNPRYTKPYWDGHELVQGVRLRHHARDRRQAAARRTLHILLRGSDELEGHGAPAARRRPGLHDDQARQRRASLPRRPDVQAARSGPGSSGTILEPHALQREHPPTV